MNTRAFIHARRKRLRILRAKGIYMECIQDDLEGPKAR